MLVPAPYDWLVADSISPLANNVKNDGPELLGFVQMRQLIQRRCSAVRELKKCRVAARYLDSRSWEVLPPLMVGEVTKRDIRALQKPRSGDLIHDAKYFGETAAIASNPKERGRYARATIALGVAAIEAFSNDALVSIYELLMDAWPSECIGREPWRSFAGRSHLPIVQLLTRGSLPKKVKYLIGHLSRIGLDDLTILERNIGIVIQARNRVLHMAYLLRPRQASPVLEVRQAVHLAKLTIETAQEYVGLLADVFEEIHLPIRTIRRWEDEPF